MMTLMRNDDIGKLVSIIISSSYLNVIKKNDDIYKII